MTDFTDFQKIDLEVLLASGAKEIFTFAELRAIPEGWTMLGNYVEPNHEYGYTETLARVLKGDSGQIYIYWL